MYKILKQQTNALHTNCTATQLHLRTITATAAPFCASLSFNRAVMALLFKLHVTLFNVSISSAP